MKTTGLRFFTVYGPWGRPDMSYFLFTKAIINNAPIKVFNNGDMYRDFTFIDDIINGIEMVIFKKNIERDLFKVYNIGNNKPEKLEKFIEVLEEKLELKANKIMYPIQPGDVTKTFADIDDLISDYEYRPTTEINEGLSKFVSWYKKYYKL